MKCRIKNSSLFLFASLIGFSVAHADLIHFDIDTFGRTDDPNERQQPDASNGLSFNQMLFGTSGNGQEQWTAMMMFDLSSLAGDSANITQFDLDLTLWSQSGATASNSGPIEVDFAVLSSTNLAATDNAGNRTIVAGWHAATPLASQSLANPLPTSQANFDLNATFDVTGVDFSNLATDPYAVFLFNSNVGGSGTPHWSVTDSTTAYPGLGAADDAVLSVTVIPEPGSVVLFGFGVGMLVLLRRRSFQA